MSRVRPAIADARRDLLLDLYRVGLAAVEGRRVVRAALASSVDHEPVHLIAIGKAAIAMAQGALDALGDRIVDGFIVTHPNAITPLPRMTIHAGDHPVPGAASLAAGAALGAYVDALPAGAPVWVLVSGGGSALVEILAPGVTAADLEALTRHALAHDVPITTLNGWRRGLSELKDGRLATRLAHCRAQALLLSDVPGDDPSLIASGLVAANDRGFGGTLSLPTAFAHLEAVRPVLEGTRLPCRVVASLDTALEAIETYACALGHTVERIEGRLDGPSGDVAAALLAGLESSDADVLLGGGETTVCLPADAGRGGRAQHLALQCALALDGRNEGAVLIAATDGCDGGSEDAGALVDGGTVRRAADGGVSAREALAAANSGACLEASEDLLYTGPTGSNVGDLYIGWCARGAGRRVAA
jgi:glycerate 2-kinase